MSVPGAFFAVTGKPSELDRIYDGIAANEDRSTAESSMSLDLWLEMRDEWFRLHDAEVRAAALAEQGTEEWEYSIAYPRGDEWDPDGVEPFDSEQDAWDDLAKGDYLSSDRVVHRRKAGPWVPVDQPASTPGVDTRTPSGPNTAEVHPDSYPDYATDRPIRHEDWCHTVTGCTEPSHCTCDYAAPDRPNRSES